MPPRINPDLTVGTPGPADAPRSLRSGRIFGGSPTTPRRRQRRNAEGVTTGAGAAGPTEGNGPAPGPELSPRESRGEARAERAARTSIPAPAAESPTNDAAFFDQLAANNERVTENDNTGPAIARMRSESAILTAMPQTTNYRAPQVEDGSPVAQGWNFGNIERPPDISAAPVGSTQPTNPSPASGGFNGGPSGSGPSESGPSESGPSGSGPSRSGPSGSGPSGSIESAANACLICHTDVGGGECSLHPCGHGDTMGKLHLECVQQFFTNFRLSPRGIEPHVVCPECSVAVREIRFVRNGRTSRIRTQDRWPPRTIDVCPVCRENITDDSERGVILPCAHSYFHYDCVRDFFDSFRLSLETREMPHVQCLMCRTNVQEVRFGYPEGLRQEFRYQDFTRYNSVSASLEWPCVRWDQPGRTDQERLDNARTAARRLRNEEYALEDAAAATRNMNGGGTRPTAATGTPGAVPRPSSRASNVTMLDRSVTPTATRNGVPRPFSRVSNVTMVDRAPTPAPAPQNTHTEAEPNWVLDQDRSDDARMILKKIYGVWSSRNRGFRFLLGYPSARDPQLEIYELEPQSRFPGKLVAYQEAFGDEIMEPAPVSNLEGRNFREFNITGVANVFQRIIIAGDQVVMPKLHAEAIVELEDSLGMIGTDWYKNSDLNRKFGAPTVRPRVHEHRLNTGQHIPIAPLATRRRQPRPYETRPISQFPQLTGRGAAVPQPRGPALSNDDELESFYEQQLRELRQRRAAAQPAGPPTESSL